jgi:hypothetical protein
VSKRKMDAARCHANCRWFGRYGERAVCRYNERVRDVRPEDDWCDAFGTGRRVDDDDSEWEPKP